MNPVNSSNPSAFSNGSGSTNNKPAPKDQGSKGSIKYDPKTTDGGWFGVNRGPGSTRK